MMWSAPGSILLAGEYRITETGGLGVAAAAGGRGTLLLAPSSEMRIWGSWPAESLADESGALERLVRDLADHSRPADITVNTHAFFGQTGKKRGYGSSATAALLFARAIAAPRSPRNTVISTALNLHRAFQGGRGSGYDVLAAAHGGVGLFRGGTEPQWSKLPWPPSAEARVLFGSKTVKSSDAITRFQTWRSRQPEKCRALGRDMDGLLHELIAALGKNRDENDFFRLISELGRLGAALGLQLGVPAPLGLPPPLGKDIARGLRPGAAAKCLGAGDEMRLLVFHGDALSFAEKQALDVWESTGQAEKLSIEFEGLRPEEQA